MATNKRLQDFLHGYFTMLFLIVIFMMGVILLFLISQAFEYINAAM